MKTAPRPPEDVKVHLKDGPVVPVECRYLGDEDGEHMWEIIWPGALPFPVRHVTGVTVAVLPAHTGIRIPVETGPVGFTFGEELGQ